MSPWGLTQQTFGEKYSSIFTRRNFISSYLSLSLSLSLNKVQTTVLKYIVLECLETLFLIESDDNKKEVRY